MENEYARRLSALDPRRDSEVLVGMLELDSRSHFIAKVYKTTEIRNPKPGDLAKGPWVTPRYIAL